MSHSLRADVIKLAQANPEFRPLLVPLLQKDAAAYRFRNDAELGRFVYTMGGGGARPNNAVREALQDGQPLPPRETKIVLDGLQGYLKYPEGMSLGGQLKREVDHSKIRGAIEALKSMSRRA